MAISTSVSGSVLTIETPTNMDSIVLIPQSSGAAAWLNYCTWEMYSSNGGMVRLGQWSAQLQNISIVENQHRLIDATNLRGTISQNTQPSVAGSSKTVLIFSHLVTGSHELKPNSLKVFAGKATNKITYLSILAEDGGGENYLDFFLTVILTEK
jgi:hypothetical protein